MTGNEPLKVTVRFMKAEFADRGFWYPVINGTVLPQPFYTKAMAQKYATVAASELR